MQTGTTTFFAPPERSTVEEIREQSDLTLSDPVIKIVLQSIEGYVLILNEHRQVLAGNREVLDALGISDDSYAGQRPGELFSCVHSTEGPNGCGTSMHCRVCGAVISILASQSTKESAKGECRMFMKRNDKIDCRDFTVQATPVSIKGQPLIIFVLQDISSAKRREVLERVFLHDISNIVSGLLGWGELLKKGSAKEAAERILKLSEFLREEIMSQSTLRAAERGDLKIKSSRTDPRQILNMLRSFFTDHVLTYDKHLVFLPIPEDGSFSTDISLLLRVLINMVKNALEATPRNGTVRVWFELNNDRPGFFVNNPGAMPEDVALSIFNRSFSTKDGTGRGIGTYSMKLFGEQYLGGDVTFTSTEEAGTTFSIFLPDK